MDPTLAARPLTTSRYVVGLATPADAADLRQLLRATPMPGSIQISLEREPDFFAAARAEGGRHYTVAIRDPRAGELVAILGIGFTGWDNLLHCGKDRKDARLRNAIEHIPTVPAVLNQSGFTQYHQLLRDVRLAEPQVRFQMANAVLAIA